MISSLQERVQKDQREIQDLSLRVKNNSMSDLLNFILTSDDALASHVMSSVDKYRQEKNIPIQSQQNPNQNPAKLQGEQQKQNQQKFNQQPQKQQVDPPKINLQSQNGGFIRDMSMMPQAFYKL
jgi:hypothetical protein